MWGGSRMNISPNCICWRTTREKELMIDFGCIMSDTKLTKRQLINLIEGFENDDPILKIILKKFELMGFE